MSDYNWVLPRISVGAMLNDYDHPQLQAEGIGYIVNASNNLEPPSILADSNIEVLNININDDGLSHYDVFKDELAPWFMDRWFKEPKKKFNFHCGAGVNRGPSTCMLALMLLGLSGAAAYKGITVARPIAAAGLAYREDAMKVAEELGYLVR